jgi:dihydrofolate synthase/folylpolyglutamate synthase
VRYAAAIENLFALQARGMRMGIERMRDALRFRGLTELAFPIVQIAGTNGKGSVSAMVASGLLAAGYRTGLFTSPHLHRFTERFRIDGRPLGTREVARRSQQLLAAFAGAAAPEVSFFELSTLLAVEAFRDHGCEVAVIEVGLGGRLDATTALPAQLSVITRIALDHTQLLGNTLPKIAREKAGIIRRGVPVIVGAREPGVLRAIGAQARRMAAPMRIVDRDFRALPSGRGERVAFVAGAERVGPLRLALQGKHQHDNAALAFAALLALREQGFRIPGRALRHALSKADWPARLERVPGRPALLLDAAHNVDGCRALAEFLASGTPRAERPRVLIFGAMLDKDYPQMLALLAPQIDQVIYLQPRIERAAPAAELQRVLPGFAARDAADALRRARRAAGSGGLVVVAGSIFLVAELRARVLHVPSDPLIRM